MSDAEKVTVLRTALRDIYDTMGYPVPDQLWRLSDCREHGWKWGQVGSLAARALRETE